MKSIRNARDEILAEVGAQAKLVHAVSLALESLDDARRFQQAIEAELAASGTRRVLVDARQAKLSSNELNESMWQWVRASRHFDRLAIVNESRVLSVAASMKATAIGTKKVKVFQDFRAAARWLIARQAED